MLAAPPANSIGVTYSRGIAGIRHLNALLGVKELVHSAWYKHPHADFVVGWGRKENTRRARQLSEQRNIPYFNLEDGFLRSVRLGTQGAQPYSMIVDPVGVYYDATLPSLLEQILNGETEFDIQSTSILERAQRLRLQLVEHGLSKYNFYTDLKLPDTDKERILVVDQTYGDKSVEYGLANKASFQRMLEAALEENPSAEVLVKTHPDTARSRKKGYLTALPNTPRIKLLDQSCTPQSLLAAVQKVYVVTSQLGFEGLLAGKPVHCFGAPFYSNWGLTQDQVRVERRQRQRSIDELVAASLIAYPRYIDPETGTPTEVERVAQHFALQRHWHKKTSGTFHCFGITPWKRKTLRRYLQAPSAKIRFHISSSRLPDPLPPNNHLLTWGSRKEDRLKPIAARLQSPLGHIEDGFIRSKGLGTDFHLPLSLVVDQIGIYFDPSHASELESILQQKDFSGEDLLRAQRLRAKILSHEISKYNLGGLPLKLNNSEGRTVILVPGQVPSDASLLKGAGDINGNIGLLQRVRSDNPDAFIIFKPHPDITSGSRKDGVPESHYRALCDMYADNASIGDCIEASHSVHTLTSLAGFEALLRGKQVVTHGRPFYAGWGLTQDHSHFERRTRRISIEQLVAGALIHYPRYIHPNTGEYSTPEAIVDYLAMHREHGQHPGSWLTKLSNLLFALR